MADHRRWLAARIIASLLVNHNLELLEGFYSQQIDLCTRLAEQKPRNYHAWSFRHWIVSQFSTLKPLEMELQTMRTWCQTHLMDHSGWNHRQHIFNCVLMHELMCPLILLFEELQLLSQLQKQYPMYEALWCHRRFIFSKLLIINSIKSKSIRPSKASLETVLMKTPGWDYVPLIQSFLKEMDQPLNYVLPRILERECQVALSLSCIHKNSVYPRRYAVWLNTRANAVVELDSTIQKDSFLVKEEEDSLLFRLQHTIRQNESQEIVK